MSHPHGHALRRGLVLLVLATAGLCAGGPLRQAAADPDPVEAAAEFGYAGLHPFGVRGVGARLPKEARATIELGLTWLVAHQAGDGGWPAATYYQWHYGENVGERYSFVKGRGLAIYDVGTSGLATLALLAAGYSHQTPGQRGDAVRGGLKYLVGKQDAEGFIGDRNANRGIYGHAFGGLAIVEAFGMTGDPALRAPAQRALDFIHAARNPRYGWRYKWQPKDCDTSVTGEVFGIEHAARLINASAEAAGMAPPLTVDPDCIKGVAAWLDLVSEPTYGGVGYSQRGERSFRMKTRARELGFSANCGVGAWLGMAIGRNPKKHPTLRRTARIPTHHDPTASFIRTFPDLYAWYWHTRVNHQLGKTRWRTWSKHLIPALSSRQSKPGRGDPQYDGSWDPKIIWGPEGGRIYSTALSLLMLLTPVRYARFVPAIEKKSVVHDVAPALRTDRVRVASDESMDPALRADILRGLGLRPPKGAATVLTKTLASKDTALLAAALVGLRGVPAEAAGSLARVAALSTHENLDVRLAALRTLAAIGGGAHVDTLRARLKDPAAGVRAVAATGLLKAGAKPDEILPVLVSVLNTVDGDARLEAVRALGLMGVGARGATRALRARLADDRFDVRLAAVGTLAGVGTPVDADMTDVAREALQSKKREEVLLVLRLVASKAWSEARIGKHVARVLHESWDPGVRLLAARALGVIGEATGRVVTALKLAKHAAHPALAKEATAALAGLKPPSGIELSGLVAALLKPETTEAAARALQAYGPKALPSLLDEVGKQYNSALVKAITAIGPAGGPALVEATGDHRKSVRRAAAEAVGAISPPVAGAVPALVRLTKDPSWTLVETAVVALGKLGWRSLPTTGLPPESELLTMLGDNVVAKRRYAVIALAVGGIQAEGGLEAIAARLEDMDRGVRFLARDGLVAMAPESVPLLARALSSPEEEVRLAALLGLDQLDAAAAPAAPAMAALLNDAALRKRARNALGGAGAGAVAALVSVLESENGEARNAAAYALARIGPPASEAVGVLAALIAAPDVEVVDTALWALLRIGKASVPALRTLLDHREGVIRREAARVLGEIGDKSALSALKKRLKGEYRDEVRAALRLAITRVSVGN